jgi:hypothetical protein
VHHPGEGTDARLRARRLARRRPGRLCH